MYREKIYFTKDQLERHIFSAEEMKEIKGILNMSEEELDNYISDVKSTKTRHPKLSQRKVLF